MSMIKKYKLNPVLSKKDVPYDAGLIFNAGITKFNGKYVMIFRDDYGMNKEDFDAFNAGTGDYPHSSTHLGLAFSDDGVKWDVAPLPCDLSFIKNTKHEIRRVYDPRLSVIDGRCYLCFAADSFYGVQGGIAVTDDFEHFELLSLAVPDNRNMVLFPEKIDNEFIRLERPFPVYSRGGGETFDIWMSNSPDCVYWGKNQLLLGAEKVPYCNCKIGPAAPPVKTEKGWLTTFHAVWKYEDRQLKGWHAWDKEYFGGIMLLDLNDPSKIIGISDKPLIIAEEDYELDGFRGSVIFPGGMILEDSGEVKIYYGAADTVECLATANVDDLIKLCIKQ